MNILDEIVANTRAKVSIAKEKVSLEDMISTIHSTKIVKSKFKASLKHKDQAIIAKLKKHHQVLGLLVKILIQLQKLESIRLLVHLLFLY